MISKGKTNIHVSNVGLVQPNIRNTFTVIFLFLTKLIMLNRAIVKLVWLTQTLFSLSLLLEWSLKAGFTVFNLIFGRQN